MRTILVLAILGSLSGALFLPQPDQRGALPSQAAPSVPEYRAKHLLAIGIDEYDQVPELKLNYAGRDALDVTRVLEGDYGFKSIVPALIDQQATKQNIVDSLAKLNNTDIVKPEDCVVVFIAGHGQALPKRDGGTQFFLLTHDARIPRGSADAQLYVSRALAMKQVWESLDLCSARHVMVICDSCFSGDLATGRNNGPTSGAISAFLADPTTEGMTASRKGQLSYEDPTLGHGFFTFALLQALQSRAREGAAFVSDDLYTQVLKTVSNMTDGKQVPLHGGGKEGGKFVFFPNGALAKLPAGQVRTSSTPTGRGVALPSSGKVRLTSLPYPKHEMLQLRMDKGKLNTQGVMFQQTSPTTFTLILPGGGYPVDADPGSEFRYIETVNSSSVSGRTQVDFTMREPALAEIRQEAGIPVSIAIYKPEPKRPGDPPIVCLDAGHGGTDAGATSGVLQEKSLTLEIAKMAGSMLRNKGYQVSYTRQSDIFVGLRERSSLAALGQADLYVSLHINYSTRGTQGQAVHMFYHGKDPIGQLFAECIKSGLASVRGIKDVYVRSDSAIYSSGFAVLRNRPCPAVLLEISDISSVTGQAQLKQAEFKAAIAKAVCDGAEHFRKGI